MRDLGLSTGSSPVPVATRRPNWEHSRTSSSLGLSWWELGMLWTEVTTERVCLCTGNVGLDIYQVGKASEKCFQQMSSLCIRTIGVYFVFGVLTLMLTCRKTIKPFMFCTR